MSADEYQDTDRRRLGAGDFTIADADGHLVITGHGFFDAVTVEGHFRKIESALIVRRRLAASVKVLVDLREAAVQSPEIADRIAEAASRLYRDGDAVAIIVGNALQKSQMKRVLTDPMFGVFLGEIAAREHLRR